MKLGFHCSVRNGLTGALEEARSLGCETFQIFSHNPRMWRDKTYNPDDIKQFKELRKKYNIAPLIVHTPYLPNLATTDKIIHKRSMRALEYDYKTAGEIGAEFYVIHPGSYSEGSTKEKGIQNIINNIKEVLDKVKNDVIFLIENVAGGGRRIGDSLFDINYILKKVGYPKRTGVCLDTCHLFGAGYDFTTKEGMALLEKDIKASFAFNNIYFIHYNDSKTEAGSHKDRHTHPGNGYIGKEGFIKFISTKGLTNVPGIIETASIQAKKDMKFLKSLMIKK
ncbi:MAG: deoxyribonuclease IV [Elusimicrobiota bacterium]